MQNIDWLIGSKNVSNLPLQPYAPETLAFCAELSAALMKSPALRAYPDITALAFWCRKGNLQRLAENCPEANKRLGRGLCFHIAPGNTPINFAFTYLFGLLSGCANIVRLPSKSFGQIAPVCEAIAGALAKSPEIAERTAFVRYPANNETTAEFCKTADARLIWGGDKTIAGVRSLPVKPRCVDICFADRYSICLLSGEAVLAASEAELARIAENFYNDTYLMDQNACSSPQLILWEADSAQARERFWNAVYAVAEKKYNLQAAICVDKYTHMCADGIELENLQGVKRRGNLLYRAELSALLGDMTCVRGKCGYFYEYALKGLDELVPSVTEKYQTVTYFGVEPERVRSFVIDHRLRGIDRIAPVGKAMDVGVIWDGFDLVRILSRIVNVE